MKHFITNDPNKVPFGDHVLFWIDSEGGFGRQYATAQAAADDVERNYPGEPVEWDVIPNRKEVQP